ncbi:MAG: hypothetical protein M9949_04980 [Candidatus Kapabacteria bacterium]|nr:hypothetical protein [Candidatus Kapabacteria bacterium]
MKLPAINTPERSAFDFLSAWERKDYEAMFKLCQITWVQTTENAMGWLTNTFSALELNKFTIQGSKRTSADQNNPVNLVHVFIKVHIKYQHLKDEKKAIEDIKSSSIINCIRETAKYEPSENGSWGVNPISVLKTIAPGNREKS